MVRRSFPGNKFNLTFTTVLIRQQYPLSGKTRKLLLVSFLTLSLTALAFLIAVYALDRNNRNIFTFVETTIQSNTRSSDLYRMLVALELDIRDLINVILQKPYKLTTAKDSLNEQFKQIQLKAKQGEASHQQQKLIKQLRWYRTSLHRLLWDYGEVNSVLYEVYFYVNNIQEQLDYMEERAGQVMIDLAIDGRNTDAVQQAYVLATIAREKILQIHILVNSSVASNNLKLLVGDKENLTIAEEDTALGKLEIMTNTLRTLTAAEENIAKFATSIQQTTPLLQDNIFDLSVKFSTLNDHYRLFVVERENTMKLLDDLEKNTQNDMLAINKLTNTHSRNTRLAAGLISFVVLIISIVGLILTRKMSRQLEQMAGEELLAREQGEILNVQLQQEVDERKKITEDLERTKDGLEQRVKERTADLSQEIEERRNTEYALATEKEQLTVTLRSIGDGVITTDMNGKIVLVNKVAEDLTGWRQDEALGKTLSEVFHTINIQSREVCESPVDILMRSGMIYNQEEDALLISRDSSERYVSESCAAISDQNSTIIGAVLVFRDVTSKKKMQDEALKSEKLKSVGVLAGGIAHDFNNILAAILGNISLAKLQIDQEVNSNARKLLEGAEKASLRARNLTQQLLTFSKGGEPVKKVELISEIIKDSTNFILTGGKVHCEYDIEDDLWPVNIDTGQMSQVVQNIIINAMHAMPDGGRVDISCSNFINDNSLIASLPEGNYVRISIKDQGTGIPEELQDKIFDPYFTTKVEGSGLGLALTHSIVAKHQGLIQLKSSSKGTDFIIYLPAMADHIFKEESGNVNIIAGTTSANILIMDDEAMVRDIARDLLVHLGFQVWTVSNGQDAVDSYREKMKSESPFDVVIMDLTIPGGMGGKEAIQRLLEIDPQVKGIVSSGYSNDPVMAEYEKHGFTGMVHKPFEIAELLKTIRTVIES